MNENLDLLQLEKSPDVWSFRNDIGIPIYLMIRFQLLQFMIDQRFNLSNPHFIPQLSVKDKVIYFFKALIKNPFRSEKKPVMIFSSGVVNSKSENGVFYNRLYEYFVSENPHVISLIETSNKFSFNSPKQSKVFYRDSLDILVRLLALLPLVSKSEEEVANSFIAYLKANGVENADHYSRPLMKALAKYKAGYHLYRFYLRVKKPKLIIVEDASYGALSYLIKAARDLDIKVAEYQHGYIGLNHPAYNFNCESLPKDIENFLPSQFLTHGEYWSKNCRLPAQKVSIGYPDLINRLTKYLNNDNPNINNKKVLFISGGTVPEKLVSFIKTFVELNPNANVLLRPHPSERSAMEQRYQALVDLKVMLDVDDLYTTVSGVGAVIGFEVSTVLYESIFFTKKIYLVDDEYANFYEPNSPFLRFDTPENLTSKIQSGAQVDIDPEFFWAENSEQRFNEFLQTVLKD
jgi:hypothetical protein